MSKTLVICEKPDQARGYAKALKEGGSFKTSDGYLENGKYVFTYGIGHLVGSKGPREYEEFTSKPNKGWSWEAIPFFPPSGELDYHPTDKGRAKQLKIVGTLIKRSDIDTIINATDAGREGELIFWEIYDYFKCKKPVERLVCSTMVEVDVQRAFNDLKDSSYSMPRRAAAYARQYADWALGMNLTVAFSIKANMGRALHVGRVQTPTIAILVQRRLEMENFVPQDYFEIEAEFGNKYKGKWFKDQLGNTRFDKKEDAQSIVDKIDGKVGTVIKKDVSPSPENPKKLYNLNDLQREASKKFNFDPTKTLNIAQLLYEKYAVLSYPRTDSRFLANVHIPELPTILEMISIPEYSKFTQSIIANGIPTNKNFINDKEVSDHHAIIPTKKKPNPQSFVDDPKAGITKEDIQKVYDLVIKRFLAVFYPPAMYEKTEIVTEVKGETFKTSGKILVSAGWKEIYGADVEEEDEEDESPKKGKKQEEKVKTVKLPPIEKGEKNDVTENDLQAKQTKGPSNYTYHELLGVMENPRNFLEDEELKNVMKQAQDGKGAGLGTGATRAGILDNIISRGYVEKKGKAIVATDLAVDLISISPEELKSPIVTAEWEQKLKDIEESRLDRQTFDEGIRTYVQKNISELRQTVLEVKFENVNDGAPIGAACPNCGKEVLEKKNVFSCHSHSKENPCFVIFKTIGKKKVSTSQAKQIASKGISNLIKGFTSQKGTKFDAKLKWNKEAKKVEYEFEKKEPPKQTNLTCPFCGKGEIKESPKAFGCSNWQGGCKFTVWKVTSGKKMTLDIVKKLVEEKQTDKMSGFKSANGKEYSARLVLNMEKKKIDFSFE